MTTKQRIPSVPDPVLSRWMAAVPACPSHNVVLAFLATGASPALKTLFVALMLGAACWGRAYAEPTSLADRYLSAGRVSEGIAAITAQLAAHPDDERLRYNLGILQFVHAIEHLGQSMHRYGLKSSNEFGRLLPFLRLPVPENPTPEPLTYMEARAMLSDLVADLRTAEETFAAVHDASIHVPVHLGLIRLNFTGSDKPGMPLRKLLAQYFGGESSLPKDKKMLTVFARADVAWFRGYCHLLMAQSEFVLGYGEQDLFDSTAHLFFARPQTPYPFLRKHTEGRWDWPNIADHVAFIHLIRFPIKDPQRLRAALGHLQQTLALSRETWRYVMVDTATDHKWLPNPHQKGVLGVQVTAEMVTSWLEFVDESEAILEGKRLVPFWRGDETRGVNLRKAFTEPRPFDLVLWIQGTAAAPYLENGTMTRPEVWQRLQRVFQGRFMGFAIWFN